MEIRGILSTSVKQVSRTGQSSRFAKLNFLPFSLLSLPRVVCYFSTMVSVSLDFRAISHSLNHFGVYFEAINST